MNNGNISENASSTPNIWLEGMLQKRDLTKPDNRSLYKYQIDKDEFSELKEILLTNKNNLKSNYRYIYWAACFCLYVSEWYRREYDSRWSWDSVEALIDVNFSAPDRTKLLQSGLEKYWKRRIQRTSSGRRELLGTLFLEGGLPWPLIHSGHHFGNLVRKGLKEYYRVEKGSASLFSIVEESKEYLPSAFQNNDSLYLIVGIIDHLMEVGKQHDFTNNDNPYLLLEKKDPNWKKDFPLPLDDTNAQILVNDWLIDAGKRRRQMKVRKDQKLPFHCTQFQMESLSISKIKVKINYPSSFDLYSVDGENLPSTRLEVLLYEGNNPLQHEGVVYASIKENRATIHFQKSISFALRNNILLPLNLRLMAGGILIEKISFENTAINLEAPTILCERDEGYELVSDSSCILKEAEAKIRIPMNMTVECEKMERLGLSQRSKWFRISSTAHLSNKSDNYRISLQSESNSKKLQLNGREFLSETKPNTSFMGIPGYVDSNGIEDEFNENKVLINNKTLDYYHTLPVGKIDYKIVDKDGNIQLKRTIGVLPSHFSYTIKPEDRDHPAQICFKEVENCEIFLKSESLTGKSKSISGSTTLQLFPKDKIPRFFEVAISSDQNFSPIILKMPYPSFGATLLDEHEEIIQDSILILDKLLGHRMILSSDLLGSHEFTISFDLISHKNKYTQSISYQYRVEDKPVIVNLFSLRDDMIQLLSTVQDQDAKIQITVMLDRTKIVTTFYVQRYEGQIDYHSDEFSIKDHNGMILTEAEPVALDISDPEKKVVHLNERCTQGVGTGFYVIDYSLLYDGPWLIIPEPDSKIQFRPRIFCKKDNLKVPIEIKTLHAASKHFSINYDQSVFDEVIELMLMNLDHSGWTYLKELYNNYKHLPFSTFEIWKAVARNKHALAILLFICDLDVSVCYRIRNELSVLWEAIPIDCWRNAYQKSKEFFSSKGVPENTVIYLLESRVKTIGECVSTLRHLSGFVKGEELTTYPEVLIESLLKQWNQETMNKHVNVLWPTRLLKPLEDWIESSFSKGTVFMTEKDLPINYHAKSVIYLPFFMARVTLGLASLNELGHDLNNVRFQIRKIVDFDQDWFFPVHSLMTNFLLQKQG